MMLCGPAFIILIAAATMVYIGEIYDLYWAKVAGHGLALFVLLLKGALRVLKSIAKRSGSCRPSRRRSARPTSQRTSPHSAHR